ncbi:ribosome biogenesis GTPase Der [bacterium]|nr:ribosome biogenesis GTPase Der [bacterium]
MSCPKVAIVGRPNVGKSSILNWLAHRRVSVVDPTAGVTRDRVTYLLNEGGRYFELIDTGGIGIVDSDDLSDQIEEQIDVGLAEADLIVFVVDGIAGVTPLDIEVSTRLRKAEKKQLLVINKCDSHKTDDEIHEFHRLTGAEYVLTSVKGNRNRNRLMEAIIDHLPPEASDEKQDGQHRLAKPELKLAIVGRRNVGKSTFINQLAESERVIVSEVAGTTRDSIDIRFDMDDKSFIAIDTPGVRKRKSLANDIEYYGLVRAKRSIRRANVVLMFFDCRETISKVDKQLVEEIQEHYKACIFVVNKWDLADDMTTEKWDEYLSKTFASMRHVPIAFITAIDGRNTKKLINLCQTIYKQSRERVSTGRLNRLIKAAVRLNPAAMRKNRRPKVYYATQVGTEPPTLVLKCNDASLFDESWKRYLLGVFREELPFNEVPIKLYFRSKGDADPDAPAIEDLDDDELDERVETGVV